MLILNSVIFMKIFVVLLKLVFFLVKFKRTRSGLILGYNLLVCFFLDYVPNRECQNMWIYLIYYRKRVLCILFMRIN